MRLKRTQVSGGAACLPTYVHILPAEGIFGCFKSSKSTGVRLILRVNSLLDGSVVSVLVSSSSATTEPVNTGERR